MKSKGLVDFFYKGKDRVGSIDQPRTFEVNVREQSLIGFPSDEQHYAYDL